MYRDMTPVALWRDSMCFWLRMMQANAEMSLRMCRMMGVRLPAPTDSDVEKICASAAKPADVPDPVAKAPRSRSRAAPKAPAEAPVA